MGRVHECALLHRDLVGKLKVMNGSLLVIEHCKTFFVVLVFFPLAITFGNFIGETFIGCLIFLLVLTASLLIGS